MTSIPEPNLKGLIDNPNQRTPCVLVLDASGSMESLTSKGRTRIAELNEGLRTFETDLKSDDRAKTSVQIAIVCVGGPAGPTDAKVLCSWTDATDFTSFDLVASGRTLLGKGVKTALEMIESQKSAYKTTGVSYTRPWLFVMTDGEPSEEDDWIGATAASRSAEAADKCIIFPIAIGTDANIDVLQKVSARPVRVLDQARFKEMFLWLSESMRRASKRAPGDTVQLPATDAWAAVKA